MAELSPPPSSQGRARATVEWAADSILEAIAAESVFLWHQNTTILRQGVLGESRAVTPGPILEAARLSPARETYLPDLQALPGRVEFGYLPRNAQAVLLQPLCAGESMLVLGTDRKRAFSPRDIAWVSALGSQLAPLLREVR